MTCVSLTKKNLITKFLCMRAILFFTSPSFYIYQKKTVGVLKEIQIKNDGINYLNL
jgi:hypothetical protein